MYHFKIITTNAWCQANKLTGDLTLNADYQLISSLK